ncbi:hypothetical protein FB45DRAFT_887148 [Roridomyces roridus]|uniref:SUN domain-containing protein n=1 Tax=Roridomyces roridus TaxID=1738132 RepID=A0AAD7CIN8_9AGAR|nr:hypothetical protein FB45DRAFT_887148 [Roridomyces roridus]
MSFTPGNGRRLDQNAFLGKPQSTRLNSHTSYSYGAPVFGSRSPPKPDDSRRDRSNSQPLDPEKWSVKGTSVNIAGAFHQAATASDMNNPNSSWASGSTRAAAHVPRSTSVEYESQSQSTSSRRLAAPPSRNQPRPTSSARAKPLSKTKSVSQVPVSEGEDEPPQFNGREKSPFEQVIGAAKRAIINAPAAATYYVRQRSREPDEPVAVNGSYDYSAEERDIQSQSQSKRGSASHKRNRMSTDNKAYKPSNSDLDESDEDFTDDDGKKKRRKKKKRDSVGGPLTSLPVAGYDKRKKKPKKGVKGNAGEMDEGSDSDSHEQSVPRGSLPPRQQSVPREVPDTSFEEAEQGLHSIPEAEDEDIAQIINQERPRSRSRSRSRAPSTGPRRKQPSQWSAMSGILIHTAYLSIHAVSLLIGRVIGNFLDLIFMRPVRIAARSPLGPILKYAFGIAVIFLALRAVPDLRLPWGGSQTVFHPPDVPAGNIAEISERLRAMELVLSGLSLDLERTRSKVEGDSRVNADLVGKLGTLETRVERESLRAQEAEVASRDATGQGLKNMRHDLETLQALVQAHQQQQGGGGGSGSGNDEEARSKLKAVDERLNSVEGSVRDALELVKKGSSGPAASPGAAWWSKKSGLTIKSSDGQDVTAVIVDLVDKAVGMYGKDDLGRADFAQHSSGAFVIPSLTSPLYEVRPSGIREKLLGYVTGNGFMVGHPPVYALHHDTHDGYCWPFAGTQGHLGVGLAAPVYIEDITIDHVAPQVAINNRLSAPRDMEVWGIVDGAENKAKIDAWRETRQARRESGESVEEEPVRPSFLSGRLNAIRLASFRYDLDSPKHIQTFPVDPEIKALGVDFGVVALAINNNWGMDDYTCLYRMRVHGQRMEASATQSPPAELGP